jgi:hypothetical protein
VICVPVSNPNPNAYERLEGRSVEVNGWQSADGARAGIEAARNRFADREKTSE